MLNRWQTLTMAAVLPKTYEIAVLPPAISQGGLDSWLEQAVYFLAGRQSCGWRSGPLAFRTKLCPQARVGASFSAAWVSRLFDFIALSVAAVYPLKN
jgi:hypothetical protein